MESTKPAARAALVAALVAAVAQGIAATQPAESTTIKIAVFVTVVAPLLAGAFTHARVVPVETITLILTAAKTVTTAVDDVADKVGLAIGERPTSR